MVLFDRRLLAYKDDTALERGSLRERMCEYQRDIQDLERKWNKCNQILRKPLLPVRDRKLWIDNAIEGSKSGPRDKESIIREIQVATNRSTRKEESLAKSTPMAKSVVVEKSKSEAQYAQATPPPASATAADLTVSTAAVVKKMSVAQEQESDPSISIAESRAKRKSRKSVKDLGESTGPLSVRVFRLKKMDYVGMKECEYVIRAKYVGSDKGQTDTTSKPSNTGANCVIQQQLFIEQYLSSELQCEVLADGKVIGATVGSPPTESDFTEYKLLSKDGDEIGTLVYAVKKADPAAVDKIRNLQAPKAATKGPILRIDKVGDIPANLVNKSSKFCIRAGYGSNPQEFKLQTQEKVPKQTGTKKMFGALIQQNLQLQPSDNKKLTIALFDTSTLLSSVIVEVGKLKSFTVVQLKDVQNKACGVCNVRIDHPSASGADDDSSDDEEEDSEEESSDDN